MRLVVVTNILAPYRIPLFNELAARPGVDLAVLLAATTEADREWEWFPDIRFRYEILPTLKVRRRAGDLAYLAPTLPSRIARLRPAVVIAGGVTLGYQAWLGARLCRARFLCWSEATAESERASTPAWRWPFKGFLARRADGCLASSSATARYFCRLAVPPGRIHVSVLPVDVASLAEEVARVRPTRDAFRAELGLQGIVFLYAGRLEHYKGPDLLLDAFLAARREREDLHLLVVGSGSMESALRARASAAAPGAVTFVGFRQPRDLPPYYAAADAFCLFSRQEPFGAVLAEALATGLPVIASEGAGATADLIEDGRNGWVIDPLASDRSAARMLELARDDALRRRMGAASCQLAGRCSPEAAADSILRAIHTLRPASERGVNSGTSA